MWANTRRGKARMQASHSGRLARYDMHRKGYSILYTDSPIVPMEIYKVLGKYIYPRIMYGSELFQKFMCIFAYPNLNAVV